MLKTIIVVFSFTLSFVHGTNEIIYRYPIFSQLFPLKFIENQWFSYFYLKIITVIPDTWNFSDLVTTGCEAIKLIGIYMETTQEILTSSPNSVEKKNLKNNGTWWEKTPSQKFIHYKEAWACSTFF